MQTAASVEMPRYKSHKTVWALKIKEIKQSSPETTVAGGSYDLIPEKSGYGPLTVTTDYFNKHNPQAGGYYVVYKDGYTSFSPAEAFEEGNTLESEIKEAVDKATVQSIGWAIKQMHNGALVARSGWNGKGMFIFLVPGSQFQVNRRPLLGIFPEGTEIDYRPHVDMKTADGQIVPWVCSQSDLLATDWEIAG